MLHSHYKSVRRSSWGFCYCCTMCLIAVIAEMHTPSSLLTVSPGLFTFYYFPSSSTRPSSTPALTPPLCLCYPNSVSATFLSFPLSHSHLYSVIVGKYPEYWYDVMIHHSSLLFLSLLSYQWDICPYLLLFQTATSGGLINLCQPCTTTTFLL